MGSFVSKNHSDEKIKENEKSNSRAASTYNKSYSDDIMYKGSMYVNLTKFLPFEIIAFLSELANKSFDPTGYIEKWGETSFFKESIWKYVNVDFGYSLSKGDHQINISYDNPKVEEFSDYSFNYFYLFIYFNTFCYYQNAEKLLDLVKNYMTKGTPEKLGEINNVARNYHKTIYLSQIRPDLSTFKPYHKQKNKKFTNKSNKIK